MPWIILLLAGVLEVAWAVGLKYSAGFTRLLPAVLTCCAMAASLALLALALRQLPLGTAYAVWTGIGAVGCAIAGVLLFNEPLSLGRAACVALILTGTLGLKQFGAA